MPLWTGVFYQFLRQTALDCGTNPIPALRSRTAVRYHWTVILLIDNYDSFVHNLARYLTRLGQDTRVARNDVICPAAVRQLAPRAIVLSPGPCTPREAGCCLGIVRELWQEIPILGVCLGHQAIAMAFGGEVCRAPEPVHGRASRVLHTGKGAFSHVPNPFRAGRYHSLIVDGDSLPECLEVTARTEDGLVMAIQHRQRLVVGWQFHPESVLTEHGYTMLAAFLEQAGLNVDVEPPSCESEISSRPREYPGWFEQPIEAWGTS